MPSPPRNLRPLPGVSRYEWNQRANRYVNATTKRFVEWSTVRDQFDQVLSGAAGRMRALSQSLRDGDLTLNQWRSAMMSEIKTTHMSAMVLQKGGWDQLTQADYGRVGAVVRREYGLLENFARQVADGSQRLDGTILRRSELYGEQGRASYYRFHDRDLADRGFDQERSDLNPADHCIECVTESRRGWVPIGDLVPIGERICRSGCKCSKRYRNSATGTVMSA